MFKRTTAFYWIVLPLRITLLIKVVYFSYQRIKTAHNLFFLLKGFYLYFLFIFLSKKTQTAFLVAVISV